MFDLTLQLDYLTPPASPYVLMLNFKMSKMFTSVASSALIGQKPSNGPIDETVVGRFEAFPTSEFRLSIPESVVAKQGLGRVLGKAGPGLGPVRVVRI